MKTKEPVRLREKTLKNGSKSLYLDIYYNGVRTYEYLHLYLNPGTDEVTKAKNKAIMKAANVLQARRLIELESGKAGIITERNKKIKFTDYFQTFYGAKPKKHRYYASTLKRWINCFGDDVLLSKVTTEMLVQFAKYLISADTIRYERELSIERNGNEECVNAKQLDKMVYDMHNKKKMTYPEIAKELGRNVESIKSRGKRILHGRTKEKKLAESTASLVFQMVCAVFSHAHKAGLIPRDPTEGISPTDKPRPRHSERAYLTIDELKSLIKTDCKYPIVKQMYLFSCFTGLRFSDVMNLSWKQVGEDMISLVMIKTKEPIYIPLSENARKWMPARGTQRKDEKVFQGYPCLPTINRMLHKWAEDAGVEKHVTFHTARHTFATMTLYYGADIYTVSSLLGHSSVQTTQIYAKIINKKREEAVNLIPTIDL